MRLIRSLQRYLNQSIRRQMLWSLSLVSFVLMLSFSAVMYSHQRSFLHQASADRAYGVVRTLATSSSSWVLSDDLAGLQEVLQGFADTPDLKLAMVLSQQGEVLAATDNALVGQFVSDKVSLHALSSSAERQVLVNQPELIDVAEPIMAGNRLIGWARVEMSRASSNNNLHALGRTALLLTLLAVIATFLVAMLLARRVTRSLYHLVEVTKSIEMGDHAVRAKALRNDEIGRLAHSFNHMLDSLNESAVKLNRINRLYSAWTLSNKITAREHDEAKLLHGICQALTDTVPFELAWVGLPEFDGWVKVHALAGSAADYLNGINVSIDINKAEGNGPLGKAIRDGEAVVFNDFFKAPECVSWQHRAMEYNFKSAAAFPIFRKEQCFGAIAVYSAEVDFFTPELIVLMQGLCEDVSLALNSIELERQRLSNMLYLERAAKVFEYSKEAILVTDSNNLIISVNPSFTEITGYTTQDVIGHNPKLLASGRHDAGYYQQMWHMLNSVGSWQGEIWNKRKSGEIYPEELTLTCVKDEQGRLVNYIGMFSDISERKLAEDRINQLAHYDVLTGLPNRILFNDRLAQSLIHAQRSQTSVALLFLDLDRFKQINDTLGHDAGDELLKMVSARLLQCVREQDTMSRQGGDEFIAVLPDTDIAGAEAVAKKMLELVIQPYYIAGHDLHVSSSIGIAIYPEQAADADTLIKLADIAMYQAKESGRNRYLHYHPSMNKQSYEQLGLENSLRLALDRREFELHYQPQVDLNSGAIIGCEALLRWRHPERGMVSPGMFIPLAEETGLIGPISDWVLHEAMHQCRAWRDAGLPDLVVAINLSALQFREGNLSDKVKGLLAECGLPAHTIDLELTETILMQGVEHALLTLHTLSALGVGISIDDFGTGYSSLSYLKRFPIKKLKIDQSFVRDISFDANDAAMVKTIILLSQSLKLDTIAEGVETEDQAAFLREAGCERAQGYLFGRPMPADEFAAAVRASLP